MWSIDQYIEMISEESNSLESLALTDIDEVTELSTQDIYETFDVHEMEMIRDIQECIEHDPGLKIEQWQDMGLEEKERVLQNVELKIAEIEGRTPCEIRIEHLRPGLCGYASPQSGLIVISANDASDTTVSGLREVVNTVVHEGRHAYQYQNVYGIRNEMNDAKYQGWVENYRTGYLTSEMYGYQAYISQPLEADAWAFADRTVSQLSFR